jgi:glutaredoxin
MVRTWGFAAVFLAIGAFVTVAKAIDGDPGAAVVPVVLFVALAAVMSPLVFPRGAAGGTASSGAPSAVVYWRPGCQYCIRLRARLGRTARKAVWINIWNDPDAAAAVRAVADGNETVPTVMLDGEAFVNPDPAWLRQRLEALPHR